MHRSVLAHGYARLGRVEEAAPLVAEITSHDLADWHVDEQWFVSICLLAETCALLDDVAPAAGLYDLLRRYAEHNAVAVPEMALDSTADRSASSRCCSSASTPRRRTSRPPRR